MMFLWDDVFQEPLRDQLDSTAGSVGDHQQEALMLLKVRVLPCDHCTGLRSTRCFRILSPIACIPH